MPNLINLEGYISKVNKTFQNDDGSKTMIVSLACKTEDPKRYQEQQYNRDFYNVSIFLPASSKLGEYLVEGKDISVAGKPFYTLDEAHHQQYFNIRVTGPEYVRLLSTGERKSGTGDAKAATPPPAAAAAEPSKQW